MKRKRKKLIESDVLSRIVVVLFRPQVLRINVGFIFIGVNLHQIINSYFKKSINLQ